jgi:hypothetical protein
MQGGVLWLGEVGFLTKRMNSAFVFVISDGCGSKLQEIESLHGYVEI